MMILAWPWALAALPLPLLARFLPPAQPAAGSALRLPRLQASGALELAGSPRRHRLGLTLAWLAWALLVLATARPEWLGDPVRRFEDAARTLADFLAQYPQGKYADTAHFWLAETHYVNRDSAAALAEFQLILKEFPKSAKVPGALLTIGYIQADAKDTKAARATLEEVIRRFPQRGEARLAQARLDQMK